MGTFCYFIDLVLDKSQMNGYIRLMTATFTIETNARDKMLMTLSSQILLLELFMSDVSNWSSKRHLDTIIKDENRKSSIRDLQSYVAFKLMAYTG